MLSRRTEPRSQSRRLLRMRAVIGRELTRNHALYLMVLPGLIYFIVFSYVPMYGVQLAFRNFNPIAGIWNSPWVGLDNLRRFLRSYMSVQIIVNTVTLNVLALLLSFPLPFLFSLLLNQLRGSSFRRTIQTISYAPHFISVVVLVGMLFLFFSPSRGISGSIQRMLGQSPTLFMGDSRWFRTLYIGSGIWQGTGWGMIIYLAALSAVNPELYEASVLDGASRVRQIVHIDVPSLLPTLTILFILNMGGLMNSSFEKVYLMQNGANLTVSEVISTYVYKAGLLRADYGYSTAVGLFNNVINLTLLIIVNAVAKRVGETSLW